jgi:hypothetical protein
LREDAFALWRRTGRVAVAALPRWQASIAGFAASPVAAMLVHYQAPTVTVDAAAIARGYVDVVAGSRFSVATSSTDGYIVDLVPHTPLFSAVEVERAGERVVLGADGGELVARGRLSGAAPIALTYRFRLAAGIVPGVYPFPLDLAVRPL